MYSDIVPGIADWFRIQELNGGHKEILGEANPSNFDLQQSYQMNQGEAYHFEWGIIGGTWSQAVANSRTVDVIGDSSQAIHRLSVTPISIWDAAGQEFVLNVSLEAGSSNHFQSNSNSWDDVNNWSQAHLPTKCEDVFFAPAPSPFDLSLSGDKLINLLSLGANNLLSLSANSSLDIDQKNKAFQNFACILSGQFVVVGNLKVKHSTVGKELIVLENGNIQNTGQVILGEE